MSKVNGVGVAFCGGGFRSYAEVAVIEDMEKNDIKVGATAGTSMGSMVAALVASGVSASKICEELIKLDRQVVEDGTLKNLRLKAINMLTGNGILDSSILEKYARNVLEDVGVKTFGDLVMPAAFVAVDLISGDLCVFTNDPDLFGNSNGGWDCIVGDDLDVAKCVVASASYPLVISPTTYRGRTFMDGGSRMNLPTALFDRSSVDAVVGVGMIRSMEPLPDVTPLAIAHRTMNCGANQLDWIYSQVADVYVNLPVSGEDAFQAGTGQQVIAEAREMLREHPIDWSVAKPTPLGAVRRAAIDAFSKMLRPVLEGEGPSGRSF